MFPVLHTLTNVKGLIKILFEAAVPFTLKRINLSSGRIIDTGVKVHIIWYSTWNKTLSSTLSTLWVKAFVPLSLATMTICIELPHQNYLQVWFCGKLGKSMPHGS